MSFERAQGATSRADQTTVRRANLGIVLQQIASGEPRSRARVAAETGLTRGTVSSLVGELIELDLLRETGEGDHSGRVGRPAQTLELGDRIVAVGLEVNVDYLAVCVEDLTGRIRHERHVHTDNRRSRPGPVLSRLARMAEEALAADRRRRPRSRRGRGRAPRRRRGAEGHAPAGSEPGLVRDRGRRRDRRAPPGLPVRADNEANLAALAEHWQGAARGLDDFICVFGEVGVGGGIFVDGELFRGAHGYGGELGHVTVEPDGPQCNCGARGCLETFVGLEAIARRAGITVGAGGRTREHHPRARAARPEAATRPCCASLAETGRYLGIGLASAVNLFDVEASSSGVLRAALPLARRRRPPDRSTSACSRRLVRCELRASEFGEGAAVRGAAALTLRSVLAEPWRVAERSRPRHARAS